MVDFDLFYEWAKDRFGEANLKIRKTAHGVEICTHSYFAKRQGIDDHKFHLWMSPSGGKSKHPEHGSYRCWLTDAMGSLVSLVANLDHIEFEEAEELVSGCSSLRDLERRVSDFYGAVEDPVEAPVIQATGLSFPEYTFLIDQMSAGNIWKIKAERYLRERKIPTEGLYVCTQGEKYGNRIVIPWLDELGNVVFWNARTLSDKKSVLRYAKPENASHEHLLFMTDRPPFGHKIYIMEGEFDAKTLRLCGFSAAACGGKYLSDTQINLLRDYQIVMAFDADKSGLLALLDVGEALLERGLTNVRFIRPPSAYKDWNKLFQKHNPQVIKEYINKFEKPYTSTAADFLRSRLVD